MAIYSDKKDGKLTGRFRVEVQVSKTRRRGRYDTLAEAKEAERVFRAQLKAGDTEKATVRVEDNRGGPKTVSQLLAKASQFTWRAGTDHKANAERMVLRFVDLIGDVKLAELNTGHMDEFILKLRGLGLAPGTINRNLSAVRRILDWGHARGRAYVTSIPEIEWQDEDEGRIRWLSIAEERRVVALLAGWGRQDIADYVMVAIDTGCRRGELLGAAPDQLDGPWLRLWANQTKTKTARSVPLTPRAQEVLARNLPWSFTRAQLRYWWDKAKEAMGLTADEDFVVHALRHTCATRLMQGGVNLRVVQQFMGHKVIETTLRYAHVSDELLASAATRLPQ